MWSDAQRRRLAEMNDRVLEESAATWKALTDRGCSEDTELEVRFRFRAPDKSAVSGLEQEIQATMGYACVVGGDGNGWFLRGDLIAEGLNPELIQEWISYMCAIAVQHDAEFEGWSAEPRATRGGDTHH